MTWRSGLLLFALALSVACAKEESDFADESDAPDGAPHGGKAPAGSGGSGVSISGTSTTAGKPATSAQAGSAGKTGAHGDAGASAGRAGGGSGGASGAGSTSGGVGGAASAGAGGVGAGGAGQGGGPQPPTMCDDASAMLLGTMSSNVKVPSNVCLKMTLPTDQTWIKKITMQPDSGMYPLPFTWSNCGTNSSGAFTANYANAVLNPVTAECPILVKLGGNGAPINIQWWGG